MKKSAVAFGTGHVQSPFDGTKVPAKKMVQFLTRYGLPAVFAVACSWGEEVTVFRALDAPMIQPKNREPSLHACKAGEKVGTLDTGNSDLADLTKKALAHDQSEDPFFGPGYDFILRDSKGQHFIVFLEYEKGHETFNGFRAGLAPLKKVKSKEGIFAGNPHQGAIFDKELLKQLKAFANRLPEPKKENADDKIEK